MLCCCQLQSMEPPVSCVDSNRNKVHRTWGYDWTELNCFTSHEKATVCNLVTVCILEPCRKNNIASDTGEADIEKQISKDALHINAVKISGPLMIRSLIVTLSLKLCHWQSEINTEGLIVTVTLLLRHYLWLYPRHANTWTHTYTWTVVNTNVRRHT